MFQNDKIKKNILFLMVRVVFLKQRCTVVRNKKKGSFVKHKRTSARTVFTPCYKDHWSCWLDSQGPKNGTGPQEALRSKNMSCLSLQRTGAKTFDLHNSTAASQIHLRTHARCYPGPPQPPQPITLSEPRKTKPPRPSLLQLLASSNQPL